MKMLLNTMILDKGFLQAFPMESLSRSHIISLLHHPQLFGGRGYLKTKPNEGRRTQKSLTDNILESKEGQTFFPHPSWAKNVVLFI